MIYYYYFIYQSQKTHLMIKIIHTTSTTSTLWSLDLFNRVISTPRRAYSPAAVSAHSTYRTHCYLCPTRYSFSLDSFGGEVRNRTAGSDIGRVPALAIEPCPSLHQNIYPINTKIHDNVKQTNHKKQNVTHTIIMKSIIM